jgi:hypothetical protein
VEADQGERGARGFRSADALSFARWGGVRLRQMLRVPSRPGPSLDARDDVGEGGARGVANVALDMRNKQPVIPSVERGTWVGGEAQDGYRGAGGFSTVIRPSVFGSMAMPLNFFSSATRTSRMDAA